MKINQENNKLVVDNHDVATQQRLEPAEVEIIPTLNELVSEDARAEDNSIPADMEGYIKKGLFLETAGMAQIKNRFNGQIFSYVLVDEKGRRIVNFKQKYSDGTYSAEFSISQSDLLTVAMSTRFPSQDELLDREASKCQRRILKSYLDKCDGKEVLNLMEVILALAEVLNRLPVMEKQPEMNPAQMYSAILRVLKKYPTSGFYFARKGGYIKLTAVEVDNLAQELGMAKGPMLELMKKKGLLYLLPSSTGYQAKVPTHVDKDGKPVYEWCYCLRDMEYYARKLDPETATTAEELNPPLEGESDF